VCRAISGLSPVSLARSGSSLGIQIHEFVVEQLKTALDVKRYQVCPRCPYFFALSGIGLFAFWEWWHYLLKTPPQPLLATTLGYVSLVIAIIFGLIVTTAVTVIDQSLKQIKHPPGQVRR